MPKSKGVKAKKLDPVPPPEISEVYNTMIVGRQGPHPVEYTFEVEPVHEFASGSKVQFVKGTLFHVADVDVPPATTEAELPTDDGSKDHAKD